MARQTYYSTREQKHPLYRTRMLTAGQELVLDAGAARLYRQLGVEMTDQKPRRAAPAVGNATEPRTAENTSPDGPEAKPKSAPTRRRTTARKGTRKAKS